LHRIDQLSIGVELGQCPLAQERTSAHVLGMDTRTNLTLPHDLAEAIDAFWHTHMLTSRNEAIRALLAYALGTQSGWKAWVETRRVPRPVAEERR
jgi:hypothetical protein